VVEGTGFENRHRRKPIGSSNLPLSAQLTDMQTNQLSTIKPVIAVDIDDVIAANAQGFVDFSNQKYGTNLTVADYQDHWGEVWKVDQDEMLQRAIEYHESGHIATYAIIDGAKDVLEKLKGRFKLIILTARRNSINQLTKEWIEKYYPGIFDDMVFSGFYDTTVQGSFHMTKGELAKSVGADYLIDDQLKHILAASELGIRGILFGNYSWNQIDFLPRNVTRATNWEEVLTYFES
jgi:uncharacterized HAD superfamily protein